jgi:hypothetical protein
MTYFTNFPKIKSTINNKSIGMIDISFGLEYDPEEFSVSSTQMGTFKTIGNLSANIYAKDANNFWGLMFANEQINPWTFLQETPSEFINANKDYTAFYAKYPSAGKLNPNAYPQLQPEDIIVKGTFISGRTAAEGIFTDYDTYFDSFGTNIVAKGFGDTKKAQISKTIGSTANANLTDPNNAELAFSIIILRKGSTGYYIANNPAFGGGDIGNLKSYPYLESSALFVKKDKASLVSPTPVIEANDSIQTIVSGDAPGATASEVLAEQYTQISTQQSYANTYQATSTVKYLNNSDLGTILKKLI